MYVSCIIAKFLECANPWKIVLALDECIVFYKFTVYKTTLTYEYISLLKLSFNVHISLNKGVSRHGLS